jgi:hypothetical protein
MSPHPLAESLLRKVTGTVITLIAGAVLWLLLALYGGIEFLTSFITCFAYILLLAFCGYMYWYITDYLRTFMIRAFIAVVIQFICISAVFALVSILNIETLKVPVSIFPLCFVYGLLCFIVLEQWYSAVKCRQQLIQMEESNRKEMLSPETERGEVIDRISVKEGSRIHIVRLDELLYLQAYGDYVTLYTENGKYLKEQTMKYFEIHLPISFVRIHRSCIVNSEKITRVELFGKESYNVYLRNGTSLRASTTGYKLLKEKMLL